MKLRFGQMTSTLALTVALSGTAKGQDGKCKPGLTPDGRPTVEGDGCIVPVYNEDGEQLFLVRIEGSIAFNPPSGIEILTGAVRATASPQKPTLIVRANENEAHIEAEEVATVYLFADKQTIAVRSDTGETLVDTTVEGPVRLPAKKSQDDWHYFTLETPSGAEQCAVRFPNSRPRNKKQWISWLAFAGALFALAARRKKRARKSKNHNVSDAISAS